MSTATTERASEADIETYLQGMARLMEQRGDRGWQGRMFDMFILEHGSIWTPERLPKGLRMRARQQCYRNTALLCASHPELRYVEGCALSPGGVLPVSHAWAVDEQDRVIDTTWRDAVNSAYYGVVIPMESLVQMLLTTRYYGFFGSDWMAGHPTRKLWRIPTAEEIRLAARDELEPLTRS